MTSEQIRKLVTNTLDVVEERGDPASFGVAFHATVADLRRGRVTVHLRIENGCALADSSMCLPTSEWVEIAEAYGRAASFFHRSGLRDGWIPAKEDGE